MIQVSGHITPESGINDVLFVLVLLMIFLEDAKQIASVMEFFFPEIGHRFAHNFSNVLDDNGMLFQELPGEQSQFVDFRRGNENFVQNCIVLQRNL